jgi:Tfp pilus assembly protein PilF
MQIKARKLSPRHPVTPSPRHPVTPSPRHLTFATLASLLCLAGCVHFDPPSDGPSNVTTSILGQSKLKARQVADVQVALGHSLEKQRETAQAMAAYKEALRLDPGRADAGLRLAVLYDQEGKFKESLPLYEKALAAYPGNADIFCDMGYSLYLQRRLGEAEINLRQALALAPEHARAHNNLGLVLAHSGRLEEAVAEFRRAGCSEADAQINLAFALMLENNWAEAGKRYEMALAIDSSSAAARKGLQELDSVVARANRVRPAARQPD